jgi:hypothetical protein
MTRRATVPSELHTATPHFSRPGSTASTLNGT